jgi:aminopeptidase N
MVALSKEQDHSTPETKFLKDYEPTDFSVESVHLHFDLGEDETIVRSVVKFKRNPQAVTKAENLRLDGEDLALRRLCINGKTLVEGQYELVDNALIVYGVPDQFELECEVMIKPQENKQLMGLYKSSGNFCTQCESEGFRRITYFYDRPDVMTTFTTCITADKDKYPHLLSNGNLVEEKMLDDNRRWVKWEDPSLKPCYLFALVAGSFDLIEDNYITMSGRDVTLAVYVDRGFREQGHFAIDALKRSMKWDEDTFGREYDLDIYMVVAVGDFNMGAMENKGLNVFNTKYVLVDSKTATDYDFFGVDRVIGHEYFHNWSGNRITCRDWFQITLKEGLTVLREQLFCEDIASSAMVRIETANKMRTVQFAQDSGPMSHPIRPEQYMEINNFYTITVYEKGSEVIRMIRTFIGADAFRTAMDLYFSRFDGQAVTTEDFVSVMEESSGMDLTQFKLWYKQGGTPTLSVSLEYNAEDKTLELTVKQSVPVTAGPGQDTKQAMQMPLSMGFVGAQGEMSTQLAGEDVAISGTRILNIAADKQVFNFINVHEKPALSLLRAFSAPVFLNYDAPDYDLLMLMAKDTDAFARWDAAQQYFSRLLLSWVTLHHENPEAEFTVDEALIDAFKAMLSNPDEDLELLTMLVTLPAESYLMQLMPVADVDAVHTVRGHLKCLLADALHESFKSCYERLHSDAPYVYSVDDVAKRSLKNVCLSYLVATDNEEMRSLAAKQYEQSDNMTDAMGALCAINHTDCSERRKALADFYAAWKDQPLVMDKWLGLSAGACFDGALERVHALMQDPVFDLLNPNKLRSVVAAFCSNLTAFHAHSGAGYAFLADQVLAVDPHNRLTAARICTPLIGWKKMDMHRQKLMKDQLQRLMDTEGLSRDVYEVVSKALI